MIMPKNRELDGHLNARIKLTSGDAQPAWSVVSGRAAVQTTAQSVEISFVLPRAEGMAVLDQLRSGALSEQTPIVLWTGRRGEMQFAVRKSNSDAASHTRATIPVSTRSVREPAPARPEMERIEKGNLVINPGRHEVTFKGKTITNLTFTEFGILHLLARHPGWVFNRQQIVGGVRGEDYPVTDRAVDVQVAGLRKKLGDAAAYIQTVRGVGYRFRDRA